MHDFSFSTKKNKRKELAILRRSQDVADGGMQMNKKYDKAKFRKQAESSDPHNC